MPLQTDGFECDTVIENVRFCTSITSDAFHPNPCTLEQAHNHPFFEGHLLLSQSADLVTPNKTVHLSKNDFCLIAPCLYHYTYTADGAPSAITFAFSFCREERTNAQDLYTLLSERLGTSETPLHFERAFALSHPLFELIEVMGRGIVGKQDRLALKMAEVLFALLDLVCPDARGEFQPSFSPSTRQAIAIDAFFECNFHRDVTIRDLADAIYLSERQTNRVLQELYGTTFKQKLIETRIQRAMQLLRSTSLSISEIAEQCGYHSPVGFHTAFRQMTEITPAKYRAEHKKKA